MSKINIIHTPCKNCVFAEYIDNTQVSCHIGQIEKFKKLGIEILEVYDDSKEFFVVNNKKCTSYRTNEWYTKNNLTSIDDAISKANEENVIKYISVIAIEEHTSIQDVENVLKSQLSQSILPKGIMIIREKYKKHDIKIEDLLNVFSEIKVPWRMQNFIDKDMTFDDRLRVIVKSAPMNRFYYLIYPSKYKHYDFSDKINGYISNGNSFGCIKIGDNLFFSYLAVMYAKNMNNINILEKDSEHQIKYEEIS